MNERPPPRVLRPLFKAPAALYRLHLGRLFGERYILLTHTCRRTAHPGQSIQRHISPSRISW